MASYNAAEDVASSSRPPSSGIVFTDSAARKVYQLITEENNFDLMLRVFITGGGCSGFQYGFTFDESIHPDDHMIEKSIQLDETTMPKKDRDDDNSADSDNHDPSVTLLIDAMSYQYLSGAEIDYQENLKGAQFIIRNPNAKTTCGCGSSFAI
ncbi:MAG: iron-sulfur cluster insertion protein ErpA [Legionellales bacterium]|nr:iron-sulfur cluster insertion protein ErpA [Legionellales bacterium]